MYIHLHQDYAVISNEESSIEIPFSQILKTIKATLKSGLVVVVKFQDCNFKLSNLRSKHYVANNDFAFINTSLKNRFPIDYKIKSPSEMLQYMLDLNDLFLK
ncbi:hypothetical protein ABMA70_09780 [Halobacteriovorax sp. XZX-3]|uniref:hypothetical protein n=1 Tax=unclassified Halobacteriovorax TaxID=2639665 RepID=UPI000CD1AE03|nr:hypothetical protein [Halobacteriovorax sp. DA5]POB13122.1 hypothetical protein C0Z22_11420 [Halobacteriovorax sp. DA5]